MNRALLIIICDFLLLSLLSLARFETVEQPPEALQSVETPAVNQDLIDTLQIALQEERHSREQLLNELAAREQRIQAAEMTVREREELARRLQAERAALEERSRQLDQEKAGLEKQFTAATSSLSELKTQLDATRTQAVLSREQLAALQQDLREREEEARRAQKQLAEIEMKRQAAEAEKQQLAGQLQVSETEKRLTREQLALLQTEVQAVRQEKARMMDQTDRLTADVSTLAEKSEELTTEIRQNRPLPANQVFRDFSTNRVTTFFEAGRPGLFGREVSRDKQAQTVLVSAGTNIFVLCHIQDTPLNLEMPGPDWHSFVGFVRRGNVTLPLKQLTFSAHDPRILMAPLSAEEARRLGVKVYPVADDPLRFEEAVLVGATEGYYGEARFRLDPQNPGFVRMDRSVFRGIFGKFNPSRGDLVFSRTGELLGIMVNNEYCAVVDRYMPYTQLILGNDVARQQTSTTLSLLRGRVYQLPFKLQ